MFQIELKVSGAHADLDGKIPLVLGTVPLAATTGQLPNTAPYTDAPTPHAPPAIQDPSQAPTQPVSPASPGDTNAVGWNLYPTIRKFIFIFSSILFTIIKFNDFFPSIFSFSAAPTYAESDYRANIVDKNESQHMRTAGGQSDFAPRYPVFSGQALPVLPNMQQ